jgi:hypothetical protein
LISPLRVNFGTDFIRASNLQPRLDQVLNRFSICALAVACTVQSGSTFQISFFRSRSSLFCRTTMKSAPRSISSAALDDLFDTKGGSLEERNSQFAGLRDKIEQIASDIFDRNPPIRFASLLSTLISGYAAKHRRLSRSRGGTRASFYLRSSECYARSVVGEGCGLGPAPSAFATMK